MQDGQAVGRRRDARESGFSFNASPMASWTNCLMNEYSPQAPSARAPNPPQNPFTPGDADTEDVGGIAIENRDARVAEGSSRAAPGRK